MRGSRASVGEPAPEGTADLLSGTRSKGKRHTRTSRTSCPCRGALVCCSERDERGSHTSVRV
eukprot:554491-Prorocentrum_minimum.AAC.1